jgi:hypothetical protein
VKYAENQLVSLRERLREDRLEDERSLHLEVLSPSRAVTMRFRMVGEAEQSIPSSLNDAIWDAELERLHYVLRSDPDRGFNDDYFDMADRSKVTPKVKTTKWGK